MLSRSRPTKEFGEALKSRFGKNLCTDEGVELKKEKGEQETPFKQAISFLTPKLVRCVVLQENITKGQRIEKVDVKLIKANGEEKLRTASTVGWKRILKVDEPAPKPDLPHETRNPAIHLS